MQKKEQDERERREMEAWLEAFAVLRDARQELDKELNTVERRIKAIAAYRHHTRALQRTKAVSQAVIDLAHSVTKMVPANAKYLMQE